MILVFRPISEIVRLFILPEIEKRLSSGIITTEALPIEIYQFLAYQKKEEGKVVPVTQLNNEFNMTFTVKLKDSVDRTQKKIGDWLKLQDIELDECYLNPPKHNGKPCAYFYFSRFFLTPALYFDCTPNAVNKDLANDDFKMKYPINDFFRNIKFIEAVDPYSKTDALISENWPPNPAYYPRIFAEMHRDNDFLKSFRFLDLLKEIYTREYWEKRMDLWNDAKLFPNRLKYVKTAIEMYLDGKYDVSIYAICPQFEGIIKDALGELAHRDFYKNLDTLKKQIFGRRIILFPREYLELTIDYLKTGTFWSDTSIIHKPEKMINRHGILHGIFYDFESQELALKFLILLDTLAFILLSDRLAAGKV